MKVRNRLALQFTLLFAVLLLIALSFIYFFIDQYRISNYFNRLDDRAVTVAQFYLAQDNLSAKKFNEVSHKFHQSLSDENFRIYNQQLVPVFIEEDTIRWSKPFLWQVLKHRNLHIKLGEKQISGLSYFDNSGNFIFVVSAIDKHGLNTMRQLRFIMTFVFVVLLIITFFLGRVFAGISLSPIVNIRDDLRKIRANDLHKRLKINNVKADEIDSLSISINQLLEHLEQSFESQQAFVSNSSHELRTPLTSILGQAEIALVKERTTEEYKAALRGIVESVVKLNDIINNLMELVQTNTDIRDFEMIRIDELAWEITDEFKLKYGDSRLDVTYQLPADPSTAVIYGNRRLLFIAIDNLLKNALKFSGGKTVNFVVVATKQFIQVEITDEGIGIAPEDVEKIFQPFYRSNNALQFPGNGIGLSLSQNIFRLHNATVQVKSQLNKGTTFTVTFGMSKNKVSLLLFKRIP